MKDGTYKKPRQTELAQLFRGHRLKIPNSNGGQEINWIPGPAAYDKTGDDSNHSHCRTPENTSHHPGLVGIEFSKPGGLNRHLFVPIHRYTQKKRISQVSDDK
jgi:hypothetical protein